jgi:hypothetical protein
MPSQYWPMTATAIWLFIGPLLIILLAAVTCVNADYETMPQASLSVDMDPKAKFALTVIDMGGAYTLSFLPGCYFPQLCL